MTKRSLRTPKVVFGVALAAIVALFLLPAVGSLNSATASTTAALVQTAEKPTPTPTPTPTPSADCEAEFVQQNVKHDGNKVDSDFEKDYAAATAGAENLTEAQIGILLAKAGKDAQVLAIWSNAFGLYKDPNNWKSLVDNGCLSKEGQKLHAKFEGVLTATGTVIAEADAPANGVNSGVHDDIYGVANSGGIYGNLRAIKVTLKDGTSVWILVRCGNVVHPSNPGLPEVPTDNPPPPKPTCPPGTVGTPPDCIEPKVPSEDPAPQGNAPEGGGKNEDTGPGQYIPPGDMEQPPDTPRVNPEPPAPQPPDPPTQPTQPTKPVPTKDPAPPPPAEPEAPEPEAPETGCIIIPGIEDCK